MPKIQMPRPDRAPDSVRVSLPRPGDLFFCDIDVYAIPGEPYPAVFPGTRYRAAAPWEAPTHYVTVLNGLGTHGFVEHPAGATPPYSVIHDMQGGYHFEYDAPPGWSSTPS